jgi:MT0933-like antitoxin protein
MGIGEKFKDLTQKAQETAAEHKDEIQQAVQKAEALADQRTEGRYHDKIAQVGAKATSYVEKLTPAEGEDQAQPGDGAAGPGEAARKPVD